MRLEVWKFWKKNTESPPLEGQMLSLESEDPLAALLAQIDATATVAKEERTTMQTLRRESERFEAERVAVLAQFAQAIPGLFSGIGNLGGCVAGACAHGGHGLAQVASSQGGMGGLFSLHSHDHHNHDHEKEQKQTTPQGYASPRHSTPSSPKVVSAQRPSGGAASRAQQRISMSTFVSAWFSPQVLAA